MVTLRGGVELWIASGAARCKLKSAFPDFWHEVSWNYSELDEEGRPRCLYFREEPSVSLQGREVVIRADLCIRQREAALYAPVAPAETRGVAEPTAAFPAAGPTAAPAPAPAVGAPAGRAALQVRFTLPFGRVSDLFGLLRLLHERFRTLRITIHATDGAIPEAEIEDKIRETFRQMGVEAEIE